MADNIPSAAEGEENRLPANAEDRKAAAALNSLNDNEISQDGSDKLSSAAAQEALGKAMSRLEIASGGAAKTGGAGASKAAAGTAETAAVKKKAVKIVAEDVTLLVRSISSLLGNV